MKYQAEANKLCLLQVRVRLLLSDALGFVYAGARCVSADLCANVAEVPKPLLLRI